MRVLYVGLILLSGCARPLTHYRVVLDPSYPAADLESAKGACEDWRAVVPVRLDVSVATCHEPYTDDVLGLLGIDDVGVVCVVNAWNCERAWANACTTPNLEDATVWVPAGLPRKVFAHELGHAMWLGHSGITETIMCQDIPCESDKPTDEDAAAWWAIR